MLNTLKLAAPFQLDRHRTASSQIYEQLRDSIVAMRLGPGALLPQTLLTEHFEVSRTPIRTALLRLEAEKLVEVFPQHLTRVCRIDLVSARSAHMLRMSLELEMVRGLARTADTGLAACLLVLAQRMHSSMDEHDLEHLFHGERRFYRSLCESAQFPDLWSTLHAAGGNLERLWRLQLPLEGQARALVEARVQLAHCIGAGDAARAEQCVRAHSQGMWRLLDTLLSAYPGGMLPADYGPVARA